MDNKQTKTTSASESSGRFDFVGRVNLFGGVSLILTVASIVYLMVAGVSYGIDFKGGTEFQVKFAESVHIDQVRETLHKLDLGEVGVQSLGDSNEFLIRFQGKTGNTDKETNELLNAAIAKVRDSIITTFATQKPDFRRVDTVGPQVGAELKRSGFLAVFYCLLVILLYVALRFDYKYSPGAVICLFHDAVITLAIFNLVGKEVNIPILAAILTLIGFSLNDTIVVFDRIRETDSHYREKGLRFVVNRAINDMLSRTIITSGTTFVSALCLFIFADGVVEDIAFAMCIGIFFGTYSSIYVAAPFAMFMDKLKALKA